MTDTEALTQRVREWVFSREGTAALLATQARVAQAIRDAEAARRIPDDLWNKRVTI